MAPCPLHCPVTGLYLAKFIAVGVGLLVVWQFYRGFVRTYRQFEREDGRLFRVSDDFTKVLFQTMGHLAKADGRVSEDEIRAARRVMHRLGLNPARVRRAIGWFDDGKQTGFPLLRRVREFRRRNGRSANDRLLFVRLLLDVVLSKAVLTKRERELLWSICRELDVGRVEFAQLEAMIRAQKGFMRSPAGDADAARLRAAYDTLGVPQDASNEQVKKAYRRLMNRNHPDKISARNPGREAIEEAERRTREIRAAYEMLKARRSIR